MSTNYWAIQVRWTRKPICLLGTIATCSVFPCFQMLRVMLTRILFQSAHCPQKLAILLLKKPTFCARVFEAKLSYLIQKEADQQGWCYQHCPSSRGTLKYYCPLVLFPVLSLTFLPPNVGVGIKEPHRGRKLLQDMCMLKKAHDRFLTSAHS